MCIYFVIIYLFIYLFIIFLFIYLCVSCPQRSVISIYSIIVGPTFNYCSRVILVNLKNVGKLAVGYRISQFREQLNRHDVIAPWQRTRPVAAAAGLLHLARCDPVTTLAKVRFTRATVLTQ